MTDKPKKLTSSEIRTVAVLSATHPESVAKRLRGEPVRGGAGVRIDSALEQLNLRAPTGDSE